MAIDGDDEERDPHSPQMRDGDGLFPGGEPSVKPSMISRKSAPGNDIELRRVPAVEQTILRAGALPDVLDEREQHSRRIARDRTRIHVVKPRGDVAPAADNFAGALKDAGGGQELAGLSEDREDRKSTRLNSSHLVTSYAVFCLKKKYE